MTLAEGLLDGELKFQPSGRRCPARALLEIHGGPGAVERRGLLRPQGPSVGGGAQCGSGQSAGRALLNLLLASLRPCLCLCRLSSQVAPWRSPGMGSIAFVPLCLAVLLTCASAKRPSDCLILEALPVQPS